MKRVLYLILLASSLSLQALTVGSYNIRNFDYDERYQIRTNKAELHSIIKGLNADVLAVEEINNTQAFEKFVANKLPGYDTELTRCGGAHGQRLGFIYNKSTVELLSFNEDLSVSNPGGPGTCHSGSRPLGIALFQVKATGQRFYGIVAHLKSGSHGSSVSKRHQQFSIIAKLIKELKRNTGVKDFLLAGDVNTTEYLNRGADYRAFNQMAEDLGMIILTKKLGCSSYWWGGTDDDIETPSLLDHVVLTPGLVKNNNTSARVGGHCQKVSCRQAHIRELGISYESVSDHCPITATIQ